MFFRGFQRRRQPTAGRRVKHASKLFLESLEDRTVPSVTINEFPIPTVASNPQGVTFGPDGSVWFVEQAANAIGRITPQGRFTQVALPTPNSQPYGITEGPDGAMWFTEQANNAIGRITVDGTITEYAIPSANTMPSGIALSPDGNIWFTEMNGDDIGEVFINVPPWILVPGPPPSITKNPNFSSYGKVTEFDVLPQTTIHLNDLTVGADGDLWFTDSGSNNIGRIFAHFDPTHTPADPLPAVTEFVLPSDVSSPLPFGITEGPDGNTWATLPGTNKIARVTTAGVITEFTVPTANAGLGGISVGQDGNLWFTEKNTSKIGRMTTAGTFLSETPTPTPGSTPAFIRPGPDGNMWLTESSANNIGEIIMPHLVVAGPDETGGPDVRLINPITGQIVKEILAYDSHFQGGVRVAMGDVLHHGIPDIVTAPGPGGGPDIRVFDGITGQLAFEFMAYDPRFTGGVNVAVGDVYGAGFADIITGADAGGGPDVRVFNGPNSFAGPIGDLTPGITINGANGPIGSALSPGAGLVGFYAYSPFFPGGVRVAAADVSRIGRPEIITGAGPGGGPHVEVWRTVTPQGPFGAIGPTPFGGSPPTVIQSFYAFSPDFNHGVYVAGGDLNGDGFADVVVGAGAGAPPEVKVFGFGGTTANLLRDFLAYDPSVTTGVRVSAWDFNGDGRVEIITSTGPVSPPLVKVFDGLSNSNLDAFFAYNQFFLGGLYIGAH